MYKTARGYKSEYWMLNGFGLTSGFRAVRLDCNCRIWSRSNSAFSARGVASSETRPKMPNRFWDALPVSIKGEGDPLTAICT